MNTQRTDDRNGEPCFPEVKDHPLEVVAPAGARVVKALATWVPSMKSKTLISMLVRVWLASLGCVSFASVSADDAFRDGGFEHSTSNGSFPDSGEWQRAWLGEAGAVCTTTAARSGRNGLWVYTGNGGADSWSGTYQALRATAGNVFRASAWIRTPSGQPWVNGSKAALRVCFLDASGLELLRISAQPLEMASTDWQRHDVVTPPAPRGTTQVQLVCYLEKPDGQIGLSVANFDDCYLGPLEPQGE
ncbi:MAG: hypothetical protein HY735_28720 [Verrucomicrobia bacterium]|nr:hypothetical protein [Verrucomicrobiota bacterium]